MPYEIHLYTGSPSAGGVNGTSASEGTELAPLNISLDGTPSTFALRCDTGRQLTDPSIILSGDGASRLALAEYGGAFGAYGAALNYVGVIQDTNVLFQIKSDGTSSLDDTSVDIQIDNGTFANIPTVPVASSLSITGTATIGQVLTGHYTYSDGGGYAEGTSTFRWLRNGSAISAATSITYTLAEADIGTDITFEVTPVNANYSGIPVVSSATSIPVPAPPSIVVAITASTENTIAFTANSTLSTETYDLYWSTTETVAANIKSNGTKIQGVTSPYEHTGLTNDTQYNYVLAMVVNGVDSNPSSVVSGTPTSQYKITFDSVNSPWITYGSIPADGICAINTSEKVEGVGSLEIYFPNHTDQPIVGKRRIFTSTDFDKELLTNASVKYKVVSADSGGNYDIAYSIHALDSNDALLAAIYWRLHRIGLGANITYQITQTNQTTDQWNAATTTEIKNALIAAGANWLNTAKIRITSFVQTYDGTATKCRVYFDEMIIG